jgi:calcium-dependent protein kinase
MNSEDADDVGRLEEQASAFSTISSLLNHQMFSSVSKLRSATRVLIASQLLLKEEKVALDSILHDLGLACNGKLSKAEVEAAFGHSLSEEEFARVDTGRTGYINYSDFLVAAMNEKVLLSDKKLRKAFDLFDKDGNGLICASDLKEAFSFFCDAENVLDDTVIQNLIKQMDRDCDGFVTYDDFLAMMLFSTDEELDVSLSEGTD